MPLGGAEWVARRQVSGQLSRSVPTRPESELPVLGNSAPVPSTPGVECALRRCTPPTSAPVPGRSRFSLPTALPRPVDDNNNINTFMYIKILYIYCDLFSYGYYYIFLFLNE